MFKDVAWGIGLLAVGVVAVGASLDFNTRQHPERAGLVPGPFKANALSLEANAALAAGDNSQALELARQNLQRRPVPAESMTLLALAAGAQGTPEYDEISSLAITAAAQRGWREPTAQLAVLVAALGSEQFESAAQRLDALYRTRGFSSVDPQFLQRLAATPEGREALATRLATPRAWTTMFLQNGIRVLPAAAFVDVVQRADAAGASFDCVPSAAAVTALLARGEGQLARALWQSTCPQEGQGAGAGIGFAPENERDPFAWRYPHGGGISRSVVAKDNVQQLRYRNTDQLRRDIAVRYLTLAPGQSRISLQMGTARDGRASGLWVEVSCPGPDGIVLRRLSPLAQGDMELEIPASGCDVQKIRIQSEFTGERDNELMINS